MFASLIVDLSSAGVGYSAVLAASVLSALLLTPALRALALRWRVVDHSDGKRKLHHLPVPLLGGVALLAAITLGGAVSVAWFGNLTAVAPLLASCGLVCVVGVVDDCWTLQPRWKLLGQLVATWPIVASGLAIEHVSVGGFVFHLGWWSAPFTIVWLVAGINAFNFIDGIDGLASLTGLIAIAALAVIAVTAGNSAMLPLILAVGGALAGFLVYNFPPARIYLGDAGSMLVGLAISVLAMWTAQTGGGSVHLVTLGLIAFVPMADMGLAVARRVQTGVHFWRADRLHIHHRLLERGFSPLRVLLFLGTLSTITAALAVGSSVTGREMSVCAVVAILAIGLVRARYFGHYEWTLTKQTAVRKTLEWTARWWVRRYRRDLPTSEELAAMTAEATWQHLVRAVDHVAIGRLEVAIGNRGRTLWRRDWKPHGEREDCAGKSRLTIESESADGGWCQLRARVEIVGKTYPSDWFSLFSVLKHFSQHWSDNVDQMTGRHSEREADETPRRRAA